MSATRPTQAGFTIAELLIGVLIGSIAMGMVFRMFVNSTEAIRFGNSQAMAVGQIQAAVQRLTREIKAVNTSNPDAATGFPALVDPALPLLPYYGAEPAPYSSFQNSSGALPFPAAPAARLFTEQVGAVPLYQSRWCPNPEIPLVPADASNSLVYYLHDGTVIHRITLRADGEDLVRLDQSPVGSTSLSDTSPAPKRQVIIRGLKSVQFTYPTMLTLVNGADAAAFDTQLSNMTTTEREVFLNENHRRVIGVRLRVAVKGPGSARAAISELRSTIQVRN